ncbi:hypothetical protein HZA56_12635 [Candidatus Poribacteria bacterium]|nr:hypothetical protein [Candidatus Poribacteria bacterium]
MANEFQERKTGSAYAFWNKLTLRDALYLGFCAVFIVITRAALRLHLSVPGHAMFFTIFFLVLGRACVPGTGAASLVGFVAGLLSMLLGMGKGGPLAVLKFVLPGLVVDAGGIVCPQFSASYAACIGVGAIASATRFITFFLVDWLIGMEQEVILQHVIIASAMNTLFGALGAALIPSIVRRLKIHQLIP